MSNIVALTLFSFILNIPFGYFRKRSKKYSLKWFLYIHLPVPLVIFARLVSHADYTYIPLFIAAAVAGQLCGGRIDFNNDCKLSD